MSTFILKRKTYSVSQDNSEEEYIYSLLEKAYSDGYSRAYYEYNSGYYTQKEFGKVGEFLGKFTNIFKKNNPVPEVAAGSIVKKVKKPRKGWAQAMEDASAHLDKGSVLQIEHGRGQSLSKLYHDEYKNALSKVGDRASYEARQAAE